MLEREINLLAPDVNKLRSERIYLERLGHLLRFTIFLGALLLVALAGAYLVVWWTDRALAPLATPATDRIEATMAQVRHINGQLAAITEWAAANRAWSPVVPEVVNALSAGMTITYVGVDAETQTLTVRAAAASREALVLWQRRLEALPWVQKVEAPLSNFETANEGRVELQIMRKARQPL